MNATFMVPTTLQNSFSRTVSDKLNDYSRNNFFTCDETNSHQSTTKVCYTVKYIYSDAKMDGMHNDVLSEYLT